jgi:hypothetical protein
MPGFYHQIPSDANEYSPRYIVNATIKNIGERFLKNVSIEVAYKDNNNKSKVWDTMYVNDLNISETKDFTSKFGKYSIGEVNGGNIIAGPWSYFDNISNVSFSITVIQ